MIILMNFSRYVILLMLLTDITNLLIKTHLINYFKLEIKYPNSLNISNFKFKQTINKYQLKFYIFFVLFFSIIYICKFLYVHI
jgi:hypothetical protein